MGHISLVRSGSSYLVFPFVALENRLSARLPSKKLETIIYYERYVVIQAGAAAANGINDLDLLAEKEYLDILNALPKGNQQLDDSDPNKFIAQMGAEAIYTLLQRVDLDELSYSLRHKAGTETSQQRKPRH